MIPGVFDSNPCSIQEDVTVPNTGPIVLTTSGPPIWAAIVSAIAAVVSAVVASAVLVRQNRRDARSQLRAQAIRLTWWTLESSEGLVLRPYADAGPSWPDPHGLLSQAVIAIRNASDDCLYELTLSLVDRYFVESKEPDWISVRQKGVLPPGTIYCHLPFPAGPTPTSDMRRSTVLPYNLLVEHVRFRDRNNRVWKRFFDGRLEQQPNADPVTEPLYSR